MEETDCGFELAGARSDKCPAHPDLHTGRKGEWQRHFGSLGKTCDSIWIEVSLEPQEGSGTPCWQERCLMPSKTIEWEISLRLCKGFWQHLLFISSVLVFKNSYLSIWVCLAEMEFLMVGSCLPPHCCSLSIPGVSTTQQPPSCSQDSYRREHRLHRFGHAYMLMTITQPTTWSLNFMVQVTWKGWGRQIFHGQYFNVSSCTTNPQNSSSSCIAVSHYQRQISMRNRHKGKREQGVVNEKSEGHIQNKQGMIFHARGSCENAWRMLWKSLICLALGENWKKSIEKETCIFFTSSCKYCTLETKHSLGSDAMSIYQPLKVYYYLRKKNGKSCQLDEFLSLHYPNL